MPSTPPAASPNSPNELAKAYDPTEVEPRWYAYWLEQGVFAASDELPDARPRYVLPMPPPNVTGSLHMGHALFCTIEDVLTRFHRMRGFATLWQPGIDHAGIATQTVVERLLKREGVSRHDLGREKFLERVWQWKAESGDRIALQQRVLGVSADWSRSKFTMDADMSRAVREAFVRLYEEGLIYRDTRLIHWDCEAQTVLSNLEVENEPAKGELFEFAYAVEGMENTELVVATTRPETMLGDTAVAVHPDDPRYTHLHGKFLVHPFVDRRIPVVCDAVLVDMAFGTGAVKVTPAHDFNDHAVGKRHALEFISVIGLDGKMNDKAGQFAGLDRFVARKQVKKVLEEKGLVRGSKPHDLMIPKSERSGTVVEPMMSTQWFVKMQPLAEPALAAVREGKTKIVPEEWRKTYEHWMENILDWCISRQLWWGHRIPAFFCAKCDHVTVTTEESPKACAKCGSAELKQDDDVLDTWFSSGLWPFATLGWPEKTPSLEKYYPASDLETGYDILFFWVARMMMMGIHFMGEPPFKRILLHGLVVDETGDKMSKVKGNVIDPLDLIHGAPFSAVVEKTLPGAPPDEALKKFKKAYPSAASMGSSFAAYGADALRFTLATYSPQAKRIPLSPKKIEGYRNFCNKVWNATRYALPYLEGAQVSLEAPKATLLVNRWILSRLRAAVTLAHESIDGFRLDDASLGLYHFFWYELCDWYLELTKPILNPGASGHEAADEAVRTETRDTLAYAIEVSLRALHPFIPFITEELWQRVPRPADGPKSIVVAPFPEASKLVADQAAEDAMKLVMGAISAVRTVRSEHDLNKQSDELKVLLRTRDPKVAKLLETELRSVRALVRTKGAPVVELVAPGAATERPAGSVMTVAEGVEIFVELKGLIEPAKELARIEREIKKLDKDIALVETKLKQPTFVDRAPPEVVAETRATLEAMREKRAGLEAAKGFAAELA